MSVQNLTKIDSTPSRYITVMGWTWGHSDRDLWPPQSNHVILESRWIFAGDKMKMWKQRVELSAAEVETSRGGVRAPKNDLTLFVLVNAPHMIQTTNLHFGTQALGLSIVYKPHAQITLMTSYRLIFSNLTKLLQSHKRPSQAASKLDYQLGQSGRLSCCPEPPPPPPTTRPPPGATDLIWSKLVFGDAIKFSMAMKSMTSVFYFVLMI